MAFESLLDFSTELPDIASQAFDISTALPDIGFGADLSLGADIASAATNAAQTASTGSDFFGGLGDIFSSPAFLGAGLTATTGLISGLLQQDAAESRQKEALALQREQQQIQIQEAAKAREHAAMMQQQSIAAANARFKLGAQLDALKLKAAAMTQEAPDFTAGIQAAIAAANREAQLGPAAARAASGAFGLGG